MSFEIGGGVLVDFWNGCADVLKFGASNIIWGLKFRAGQVVWDLIFLCPQKFTFSLKILGVFENIGDLRKFLDISTPVSKSQSVPPGICEIVNQVLTHGCINASHVAADVFSLAKKTPKTSSRPAFE